MANRELSSQFYDPSRGDPAIRVRDWRQASKTAEPVRTNYFAVYCVTRGRGVVSADTAQIPFAPNTLLFFVPYQQIRFDGKGTLEGEIIEFHANFLCVETFHAEAGCSGILFNDPYGLPVVSMIEPRQSELLGLIERLKKEQDEAGLAHGEAMLAYLKVFLILAARLKSSPLGDGPSHTVDFRHPVIAQLRELIEKHYPSHHHPADYAERLHMTAKTLGRVVREQLGTTLTELIRNRVLIHAKWQLLHTLRPVKEISRELGFTDELYFSRLFKKATGQSPIFFRELETRIRGGSNLSMFSGDPPIS